MTRDAQGEIRETIGLLNDLHSDIGRPPRSGLYSDQVREIIQTRVTALSRLLGDFERQVEPFPQPVEGVGGWQSLAEAAKANLERAFTNRGGDLADLRERLRTYLETLEQAATAQALHGAIGGPDASFDDVGIRVAFAFASGKMLERERTYWTLQIKLHATR